ncbi:MULTISPECIES: SUKH-4 family immunity protein [Achromobacter]|jgi:hypothetical protein|uniref:SUKH-4 immunity protein of toxin-antitoxin system n=1 Tax=Achromobacter dolens TaxID=1287738 RepID=A0A6S7CT47_9BURK|nr:SUKH-4 family immunity protein [Achromobacter dolens]MBQ2646795.1 SUKH-4 family immunity protein [Achromobacter sp.]MCZ8411249.1 SUKH-4 family immunity protein [Achromobacter dolens]CAB3850878.1 hypothetical protein LMG26841_01944 [Achromobacter dolens]CAB3887597.1 hypothetical protein LMG26842_04690 [Achromobacter dolens]CUJ65110.1 Uncharacterised protein [Achromobacter dolens]
MTDDDLAGLYAGGATHLDAATLATAGLDPSSRAWLADHGLPLRPEPAIPLLEFVPPRMHAGGNAAVLVIAREPWADALWIGIAADGRVVTAGADGPPILINSRITHFLHFLAAFQRFQRAASRDDAGPRVYTQAEMQARLDALRQGQGRRASPPASRAPATPALDRPAALRRLEQAWRDCDAAALARGGWWLRIREQLRDGLL